MCVRISIFIFYQVQSLAYWFAHKYIYTGKSVSEALLESVNPQYDKRLFIEFQKNTSWQRVVYNFFVLFCFDIQNNISVQHVVNLYFLWNSMNNLLSSLQETHMFSTLCPTQKVWCCVFLQA